LTLEKELKGDTCQAWFPPQNYVVVGKGGGGKGNVTRKGGEQTIKRKGGWGGKVKQDNEVCSKRPISKWQSYVAFFCGQKQKGRGGDQQQIAGERKPKGGKRGVLWKRGPCRKSHLMRRKSKYALRVLSVKGRRRKWEKYLNAGRTWTRGKLPFLKGGGGMEKPKKGHSRGGSFYSSQPNRSK